MSSLIETFQHRVSTYMKDTNQQLSDRRVLVGVSGGIDSVVLLDVLNHLEYECEVVHINFQLRGSESAEDQTFVTQLCDGIGVVCHVYQVSVRSVPARTKSSVQMMAREIRYEKFAQIASQRQIPVVAVGHHGDDQAESLLMNLNRGTGPEGIAGMRPIRNLDPHAHLIRPLLAEDRASIRQYAEVRKLEWREDASNQDEAYARAKLRRHVMPHLNSDALARSSNLVAQWVDQVISPMITQSLATASRGTSLRIQVLQQLPPVLAHRLVIEALRNWLPEAPADETHAKRIMSLIDSQPGKRIEFGSGMVCRDRLHLTFTASVKTESIDRLHLFPDATPVIIPGGQLRLDLTTTKPSCFQDSSDAWLDAEKLTLPLTIRSWLPGDRLRPFGMEGTKKVSDLLTDNAVPASRRSDVCVVCSGKSIVWIVGHRMSHTYRITKSTSRYARLSFERN